MGFALILIPVILIVLWGAVFRAERSVAHAVAWFYLAVGAVSAIVLAAGSFDYIYAVILLVVAGMGFAALNAQRRVMPLRGVVSGSRVRSPSHEDGRGGTRPSRLHRTRLSRIEWCCVAVIAVSGVFGLAHAFAPVTAWDAASAHAALAAEYARAGQVSLIEGQVYSAYPQALHGLWGLAFWGGGERSAALLAWVMAMASCGAMFALGDALAGRATGWLSAAAWSTTPIFVNQTGTFSLDVIFAGFAVAAMAVSLEDRAGSVVRRALLAGAILGLSAGIRHTAYLIAPMMAVLLIVIGPLRSPRALAAYVGAFALGAMPWLMRGYVACGNPVYPFLGSWFPTPNLPDFQSTSFGLHETTQHLRWSEALLYPWNIVMHPDRFDGWSASPGGLVWILAVPAVVYGARRVRSIGAYSLVGVWAFFGFQQLARYALPFFAPAIALAAATPVLWKRGRKPAYGVLAFSMMTGLMLGAAATHFKWAVAVGAESRDDYLHERVERYEAFAWINEHVPADARVLTLDPRGYFIEREVFTNVAVLGLMREWSIAEQSAWLRTHGITHIVYPEDYVESPLFVFHGYVPILDGWRNAPAYFEELATIETPRRDGEGMERTEVYRVIDEVADVEP